MSNQLINDEYYSHDNNYYWDDINNEYYDYVYSTITSGLQIARMVGINVIVATGLIGNILLLLFMRHKKFRSQTYSIYLSFLAVTDSFVLFDMLLPVDLPYIFSTFERTGFFEYVMGKSIIGCKLFFVVVITANYSSPWLIVFMTMDRFISVVFPLKRHFICTKLKTIILCSATLVVSLAMAIYEGGVRDNFESIPIGENQYINICNDVSYETDYFILKQILKMGLPLLSILVLNVITVVSLVKAKRFRLKSSTSSNRGVVDRATLTITYISIMAFVTLLPWSLVKTLYLDDLDPNVVRILMETFEAIFLLNFAQNFYVFVLTSMENRKLFANMCCCCLKRVPPRNEQPIQRDTQISIIESHTSARSFDPI